MKTNLLKILIAIVLILSAINLLAQEKATLNYSMDAKLLLKGDDKGNEAGTINYNIRSEWQGKQFNLGYMFIAPEFEYADLQGGIYRRYSANAGYTFNQWIDKIDFTASVGYGIIQYNGGYRGFGCNFQTSYEIVNGVKIFLDAEIVDRKDLEIYGSNQIRFSGKFGVKADLFRR